MSQIVVVCSTQRLGAASVDTVTSNKLMRVIADQDNL